MPSTRKQRVKFTNEDLESAINLYKNGNNLDIIAKQYNISRPTLSRILKRNGVIFRNNHIWVNYESKILEIFKLTNSVSEVMKILNLKRDVITETLKRNNIFLQSMKEKYKGIKSVNHPAYKGSFDSGRSYLAKIRKSAKKRNLEISISIDDMNNLWKKQGGFCALSGLPITYYGNIKNTYEKQTGSLDRIDNTKGYCINNIQWVHKDINQLKWCFEQNYFLFLCQKITSHQEVQNANK